MTTPTATVIELVLSYPPTELSPNARTTTGKDGQQRTMDYHDRAAFASAYKDSCRVDALNARRAYESQGVAFPLAGPVTVSVTFVLASKRRRDWDNALASFKHGLDSIVAAGLIEDDSMDAIDRLLLAREFGPVARIRVRIEGKG